LPAPVCKTRREYIPVGSTAASLLPTVVHTGADNAACSVQNILKSFLNHSGQQPQGIQ
jgi:hypothetical protein